METSSLRALDRRFRARLDAALAFPGGREAAGRILAAAGEIRGRRALEVGCGSGELARALADRGARVTGLDPSAPLLEQARAASPAGGWIRADAHALPFADASFDLGVSVLVLHYLRDPRRALLEIRRVLRPGSALLLCDRTCSADPVLRAAQLGIERLRSPQVHRFLSPGEVREFLQESGFEVRSTSEFAVSVPLDEWLVGTEAERMTELRDELDRLSGRDLGGFRVSGEGLELRLALFVARASDFP